MPLPMKPNAGTPNPYATVAKALTDLPATAKAARTKKKLTVAQAAKAAGIGADAWGNVEAARTYMTKTALAVLAWLAKG